MLCFILLGLKLIKDFAGCTVGKNPLANTGDTGSIPGPERFPESHRRVFGSEIYRVLGYL